MTDDEDKEVQAGARVISVDRETIDEKWYCGNCRTFLKSKWKSCPKCGKSLLWKAR